MASREREMEERVRAERISKIVCVRVCVCVCVCVCARKMLYFRQRGEKKNANMHGDYHSEHLIRESPHQQRGFGKTRYAMYIVIYSSS